MADFSVNAAGQASKINLPALLQNRLPALAGQNLPAVPSTAMRVLPALGKGAGVLSGVSLLDALVGADPSAQNLQQLQQGVGANPTSPLSLVNPVVSAAQQGAAGLYNAGNALNEYAASDDVSPVGEKFYGMVGDLAKVPVRVGTGLNNTVDAVGDYLGRGFTPKGELNKPPEGSEFAQQEARNARAQQIIRDAKNPGMNGEVDPGYFDMGQVGMVGGFQLPPPPDTRGDWGSLQEMVDKQRPDQPSDELKGKMAQQAAIMGALMGVRNAADNGGNIMRGITDGITMGNITNASYQQQQEEKIREDMNRYWDKTIGIKKAQMEDDAQYQDRVYRTQVANMESAHRAGAANAERMQTKMINTKDGLYLQKVVKAPDGSFHQVLQPFDMGIVQGAAVMQKDLTKLVGEKKAQSLMAMGISGKQDPEYAAPTMIVANAMTQGRMNDLAKQFGLEKVFQQIGTEGMANVGGNAKEAAAAVDNKRMALLMEFLRNNDAARNDAYNMLGMINTPVAAKDKRADDINFLNDFATQGR